MSEQLDLFDQPLPEVVTILTFNQAMRLFVKLYWGKKKMFRKTRSLIRYLAQFFDGRFIETFTRQDIFNLRDWLKSIGLGPSQINKAHMLVTLLINKLEDWKEDRFIDGRDFAGLMLPRRNPGMLVKKAKEPTRNRFIVPSEFKHYIKFCVQMDDMELADILRMGLWARLSPIDLLNLNDSEINEGKFQIELYRRHTKTDKNPQGCLQVIPMTERMWALLQRRKRFRKNGQARIFGCVNLRKRLDRLRKVAIENGHPDFRLSDLRRAGSGYLYERGVDTETRADGLGHTSTRITKAHYTPRTKPHLKKSTQILVEAY